MSKTVLMVVGVLLIVMGLLGLPVSEMFLPESMTILEPIWLSVLKIVIGIVALGVAVSEK